MEAGGRGWKMIFAAHFGSHWQKRFRTFDEHRVQIGELELEFELECELKFELEYQ